MKALFVPVLALMLMCVSQNAMADGPAPAAKTASAMRVKRSGVTTVVSPLQVTFTSAGVIQWRLNGTLIASGTPHIQSASPAAATGASVSKTEEAITQPYPPNNLVATYDCAVNGTDVTITAHIVNNGTTPTAPIVITYPSFTFSAAPTGTMPSWNWTYLAAEGLSIYHPSVASPLGCVYAGDSNYAVAAWSPSEISRQSLIQAHFTADNVLPNPLPIELHTVDSIAAGASADISMVLRVTTDQSATGILSGYKSSLSAMSYTPVAKPAIAFQAIAASWVTATNPYGYDGDIRRIDLPQGVQAYLSFATPLLKSTGGSGVIFWAPGGYQTGSFYPVDFDVNLNRIFATWPTLVAGLQTAGYRVGICARLADALNSDGSVREADPTNATDVSTMLARVDSVAKTGVTMWYIDSACNDYNTTMMLGIAAKHLGSGHIFFSEYANDVSMSFSGVYCEWMGTQTRWLSEQQRTHLRTLFPNATWLCMDRTGSTTPSQLTALGFEPLTGD